MFKRLVGVKPKTFKQMVEIVKQAEGEKKRKGRASALGVEEQVLLTFSSRVSTTMNCLANPDLRKRSIACIGGGTRRAERFLLLFRVWQLDRPDHTFSASRIG